MDNGIQGYPTWKDAAGNFFPGVQSLEKLAEIAGCSMDGNSDVAEPGDEVEQEADEVADDAKEVEEGTDEEVADEVADEEVVAE